MDWSVRIVDTILSLSVPVNLHWWTSVVISPSSPMQIFRFLHFVGSLSHYRQISLHLTLVPILSRIFTGYFPLPLASPLFFFCWNSPLSHSLDLRCFSFISLISPFHRNTTRKSSSDITEGKIVHSLDIFVNHLIFTLT